MTFTEDQVGTMLLVAFGFGMLCCMLLTILIDWLGDIAGRYAALKMNERDRVPCCFCGSVRHQETCDSPGAIVTGTTGCPTHDSTVNRQGKQ